MNPKHLLPRHASEQALPEGRERRRRPVLPHGKQIVDYLPCVLAGLDGALGTAFPIRTRLVGVRLEEVGEVQVALRVVVDAIQAGPELGREPRLEAPDAVLELTDLSATGVLRTVLSRHVAQVGAELDAAVAWVFGRAVPEHGAPEHNAPSRDLNRSPASAKVEGVGLLRIEENRSSFPIVYLFETVNQADVLDVLDTLKEAMMIAMQALASPQTPDRVQASVEFSETLKALEGYTPQDLQPIYLEALQQLRMQLINTCKVEAHADGASYKVTIFTFGSPPHPLDGLLIEDTENSGVRIGFDGKTHFYLTEAARYVGVYPGFTITIGNHAEMTGLWLALTAQLNQFRIANIDKYTPDYSDPAMQDKFAGPIGPWRRR